MSIKENIHQDIKNAMRAKERDKLEALRLITAAIKQIEVDERIEVDDARLLTILDKLAKQRKEAIAQFTTANRQDLVDKEQFELTLINAYLPPALSDEELEHMIADAMAQTNAQKISDMGKVMAILKPNIQGRCDMAKVSASIKSKLE